MVFTTQLEVVNTGNLGTAYALAQAPSLDRSSNSLRGSQFPPRSAGSVFLGPTSEQLLPGAGSFPLLGRTLCFLRFVQYRGAGRRSCLPPLASKNSSEDGQHLPAPPASPKGAQHLLGLCHQGKDNEGLLGSQDHERNQSRVDTSLLCPADAEEVRGPSGRGRSLGVQCPGSGAGGDDSK